MIPAIIIIIGIVVLLWGSRNIIPILDFTAHCITGVLFHLVPKFKRREMKIMDANLRLFFPNNTKIQNDAIKFSSVKLTILNALFVLHQPILYNCQDYYLPFTFPEEFLRDVRRNKCILVTPHYGIYYDLFGFHKMGNLSGMFVYKLNNRFIERYIFKTQIFARKVHPVKHNELQAALLQPNPYDLLVIPCDQKAPTGLPVKYLNQSVKFHSSPATIHKMTKRSVWAYFVHYSFAEKKLGLKMVPIQRLTDGRSPLEITQAIADVFSQEILAHPEQYLWAYNRFDLDHKA